MKVKSESEVAQSCLTLRDSMDCSLPGEVHGIFPWQEYWSGVLLPSPVLGVRTPIYHLGDITQCNSQNPGRQKQEKIFPLGIASESVLCHGITQGSPEKQTIRYILAKTFISTDPWTWVLLVLGLLDSDWGLHCRITCPPPPYKFSALGLGLNYTLASWVLWLADCRTCGFSSSTVM